MLTPFQPRRNTHISLYLNDRIWQPGGLTETWVIMWRGAKAWALLIQVEEQHRIAPLLASVIPFQNSERLRGFWTSTRALERKHTIRHFLDFKLGTFYYWFFFATFLSEQTGSNVPK